MIVKNSMKLLMQTVCVILFLDWKFVECEIVAIKLCVCVYDYDLIATFRA